MSDLTDELIRYSEDCISGVIPACQKHQWACMRFLQDIERQNTDDFPFVFDEEKACRFLDWMRLFKHRKGVLRRKHIEPHIIQKFVFGNIYGWIHAGTGYRRFNKAYWQVARKNAKSQSLACVGTYEEAAMDEGMAEVYCAATKRDQAHIVWDEAEWMVNNCPELKGKFKIAYNTITHIKTGSTMRTLSKEDKKTGDGLNPQCGIVDEYQAHETGEYYEIIDSGMVARPQPLLMIITTAGFDLSRPCYAVEYDLVSNILNPDNPIDAENYFVMINELDKDDDIADESAWPKPNPIVCSYPEGVDALRKRLKLALYAPEKMRDFMTKSMNVWVQQKEAGYMDMSKWKACGATKDNPFPDVAGLEVIAGIDLSLTTDLTSVSFEIRLPDGRAAVMSHSFMPEDALLPGRRTETERIKLELWAKQGWITATPGAVVDYDYVLDYISAEYEKHGWKKGEVCYDRALAAWLSQQLEKLGFTPVEIPQGMLTLGAPTKKFRDEVYLGHVIHDNNPVLAWAMGNAVTRQDNNENVMLDKTKSRERIDPAAALMNAHVRYAVKPPVSVYETRGIRMV